MTFALPIDPTPTSIEAAIARLPAEHRAALSWFPQAYRQRVVRPLAEAPLEDFERVANAVIVGAAPLLYRLMRAVRDMTRDIALDDLLPDHSSKVIEAIEAREHELEPRTLRALMAAYQWLAVVLAALGRYAQEAWSESPDELVLPGEAELQRALCEDGDFFLRGLVLTIAAVDIASSDGRIPASFPRWCMMATREMQAAANELRAAGLAVPTAIRTLHSDVPIVFGSTDPLPPGVLERIRDTLAPTQIWLFGSRARGTHGPESDWDVFVVVPDDAAPDSADVRATMTALRRRRVDLVVARASEFEEGRAEFGSLASIVAREGYRVDADQTDG